MLKQLAIVGAITAAFASSAFACTTILLDKAGTADHSYIVARSVDGHENVAQWAVYQSAVKGQRALIVRRT